MQNIETRVDASTPRSNASVPRTVVDAFTATTRDHARHPALHAAPGEAGWTWSEYRERVRSSAAGLAELGYGRGDVLACWLNNRPEFHVMDLAAVHLGAASFSVYPTYTADQAAYVIADAGSRVLVTESAFLESALAVLASGETALTTIVCVDGGDEPALTWKELAARGAEGFELDPSIVNPDDVVTLIYTSGTTGPPKGVELTHRNVMAQVGALTERLEFDEGRRAVSWLPMAHIAERLVTHYLALSHGWEVTTCADGRRIAAVLPQVRPQVFFSPPRLWEKLRGSILARFGGDLDEAVASRHSMLADLGLDDVQVAIVGAAPCPTEVIEFWHALGVPLDEVYGASETTGVATVNPADAIRIGTAGTALPGVEVVLSDAGEVLVRGPVVMKGYRNMPAETAEAIDPQGWLHTGDIGVFDDDGYLRIVDRIKEIIINAAGKNMSPVNIEATLKAASPVIGTVVCIGDRRPYNTALILLDSHGGEHPDPDDPGTVALVQEAVERANQKLARAEQIKRFRILAGEWQAGGDELTPTMKLKRSPIAEKYAAEIEELYT